MRILIRFCQVIIFSAMVMAAQAQTAVVITGKVTDKQKRPLSGVSVTEIDADNRILHGVATDVNGNFALHVSDAKHRISFSFIGYKSQEELAVNSRKIFNITLDQAAKDIEEVIVIAQKRTDNGMLPIAERNSTLAYSKISAKEMEEMQATSIDQALQGRIA